MLVIGLILLPWIYKMIYETQKNGYVKHVDFGDCWSCMQQVGIVTNDSKSLQRVSHTSEEIDKDHNQEAPDTTSLEQTDHYKVMPSEVLNDSKSHQRVKFSHTSEEVDKDHNQEAPDNTSLEQTDHCKVMPSKVLREHPVNVLAEKDVLPKSQTKLHARRHAKYANPGHEELSKVMANAALLEYVPNKPTYFDESHFDVGYEAYALNIRSNSVFISHKKSSSVLTGSRSPPLPQAAQGAQFPPHNNQKKNKV
jgi:hypothetical protein